MRLKTPELAPGMYLDGYLRYVLDTVYTDVRKDYDSFIIISGREGFGKSTLASQIALYLDRSYNIDRCTFTAEQFEKAVLGASKYQAVVFDETMGYLGSRGAMSRFNKRLIKIMSEMRSRNLIVILCIPNFFELDRYPAIHRSTGLLHVYQRGRLASYDYKKKKLLYLKGKKMYSYHSQPPTFKGVFTKFFPLPKEEYEQKKQLAIASWDAQQKGSDKIATKHRNNAIIHMNEEIGYDNKKIAEVLDTTVALVNRILEDMRPTTLPPQPEPIVPPDEENSVN